MKGKGHKMTKEQQRILSNVEGIFVSEVKDLFGDNLTAVILYGSAVAGSFTDRVSDVNVLILLEEADPKAIIKLGKGSRRSMRKNRINPLLLTVDEYLGSADVFPLEYLDIIDTRKLVYGKDPTEKLSITPANLRHQVESQLRGTIADLRRALLASHGRNAYLKNYLKHWFGAQNALWRGVLRVGGEDRPSSDIDAVAKALEDKFAVDTSALQDISRIRGGEKIDSVTAVENTLLFLGDLVRKIDSMAV